MSPSEYVLRDIPDWERAEDLDAYMMIPLASPSVAPQRPTTGCSERTPRRGDNVRVRDIRQWGR